MNTNESVGGDRRGRSCELPFCIGATVTWCDAEGGWHNVGFERFEDAREYLDEVAHGGAVMYYTTRAVTMNTVDAMDPDLSACEVGLAGCTWLHFNRKRGE